ncbi:cysteine--tRNA ligase [Candidatus Venteria ishoeyi]|uniref:NERD domain-containing protein n=1 Tax=Candidatus Venteria ishoeyi TaxID=1899563 RepID=A0A1H6F539_9GAMM|nr:hypothetical protein [Candidatus Venteria ishoeyi]SEH04206.1 Uncharacterised protein [Candidatus Venteria ishoeyi]
MPIESGLNFAFNDNCQFGIYDKWGFYHGASDGETVTGGFKRVSDRISAVDFIVIEPENIAWFIEVKNYCRYEITERDKNKISALPNTVTNKMICTLAALLPAKLNAGNVEEKKIASAALNAKSLRVVLHLELPSSTTSQDRRLFERRPAQIERKLSQKLKNVIGSEPLVLNSRNSNSIPWTVNPV